MDSNYSTTVSIHDQQAAAQAHQAQQAQQQAHQQASQQQAHQQQDYYDQYQQAQQAQLGQSFSSTNNNQIINNFHNQHGSSFSSSMTNNFASSPGMNPPSFHTRNSLSDIRRPSSEVVGSFSDNNNEVHLHRGSSASAVNAVRTSLLTKNLQAQAAQQQQQQHQPEMVENSPFSNANVQSSSPAQFSHSYNNNNNNNNNSLSAFQIPITSSQFQRNISASNSYTPFHNPPSAVSNSYSSSINHNQIPQQPQQSNGFINMSKSGSDSSYNLFQQPHPAPPITTTDISVDTAFANSTSNPSSVQRQNQHTPPPPEYDDVQMHQRPAQQQQQVPQQALSRSGIFGSKSSIASSWAMSQEEHLNIAEHPTSDLLLMLSALLQKIIEANDLLHPEHQQQHQQHQQEMMHENNKYTANVLAFHGRNVPAISLHAYLTRILKYCPMTNDVFLSLLVYFDRIAKRANAGDLNNNEKKLFVMDSYNIHRLIISGVTVASKFFSDVFYKNSRYAKVGGLPLEELNHLELQFLLLLDFKLMIQLEEMVKYGDLLIKFWKREQMKHQAAMMQQQQQNQNQNQTQEQQQS